MYKSIIILGLVSAIFAAPAQEETTPIPILKMNHDGPNPDGSYNWAYETGNGIQAQEQGAFEPSQNENEGTMRVQGSYRYTDADGTVYEVIYTADENGFQPQGAHLPTPPPIPEDIAKALEYIAAHPEENNIDAPKQ
ncbi:endocuticle structural glycoprotein ABD-4-like [Chelonus insularis]|uniref:endocuticle structural glycoprotein ABD-4-like n=1 Tax=Chelonus insularis TaxID=460826 RepID=UPI00158D95EA|nr:endocuticle structural glycoprotein ABD-4-like [Chelonus insularis]